MDRRRIATGLALIALGLVLYSLQFIDVVRPAMMLLLIGGAFMAWYFYTREYGLLIPACILMGLGVGAVWTDSFWRAGSSVQFGLGIGFLAIYIIALVYEGKTHWWPLIPGSILVISGLRVFDQVRDFLRTGWPLIIVFIGIMVLFGALGKRTGKSES